MARADIPALLQVAPEDHDLDWLHQSLQWAVELEFATIPTYLSGMWSIKDQTSEVYALVHSVVLEEMLHLALVCNMLKGIGGTPQFNAPTFPGPLPGGVAPDLTVFLAGLSAQTVEMYMRIEQPEQPVAATDETYPTIGAFYDAISKAFANLNPQISPDGQLTNYIDDPIPDGPAKPIHETFGPLGSVAEVQAAIETIKEQGEGTSTTPDATEFGESELAHYYRFGEISNGKKLVPVGGGWEYAGDPVPFPECWPVLEVPRGGYPGVAAVQAFDVTYGQLLGQLQGAWANGDNDALSNAIGTMFELTSAAAGIVNQPLPSGGGNYGPDFVPANAKEPA